MTIPVPSLPIVAAMHGETYVLSNSIGVSMASGAAIDLQANYITIDLNGHHIYNTAGTGNEARGIDGHNRYRCRIVNGWIDGFRYGIELTDDSLATGRHVLEDLHISAWDRGIRAYGTSNVFRRVRMEDIGGTTASGTLRPFGFDLSGPCPLIEDCSVTQLRGNLEAVAFSFSESCHGGVARRITAADAVMATNSFGFWVGYSNDVVIEDYVAIRMWEALNGVTNSSGAIRSSHAEGCNSQWVVNGNWST